MRGAAIPRRSAPLSLMVAAACGGEASDPPPAGCPPGLDRVHERCVEPATRYEPDERLDFDNVVAFGEVELLELPEPPKSGFRVIMPPLELQPGEERTECVSWNFPAIHHHLVYSARAYTTNGLHHSNVFSNPIDQELGENPYPGCHPGGSDAFAQIAQGIPDMLFANSTQVEEGEGLVFPPGMGFRVHPVASEGSPAREITADVHALNTQPGVTRLELAYDFYTMPEEELVHELAPFVVDNREFSVPPQQTQTALADCLVWDGTVVSLMAHTHQYAERVHAELVDLGGTATTVYLEEGYDLESDIGVFDPGISLDPAQRLRFSCQFRNTTDRVIDYGLGDGEMCILFGYLYPVEQQFVSFQYDGGGCETIRIGVLH
jgi:hypothetical protein